MKGSKDQLKKAVLVIARILKKEKEFQTLIDTYQGMPTIIKMIVYEMFLANLNELNVAKIPGCTFWFNVGDEYYNSYILIHAFAKELDEKGMVEFEN